MKLKIITFAPLVLIIALSFVTILPLLGRGFFPMHDDTQPARLYEMAQALADGQFPVRWVRDLGYGYGYPLFNFYAPLPYYIGAIFNLLGLGAISSAKIMMGIGMVLSGITMYLLVIKLTSRVDAAIVASCAYLLAPYHAVLLYVRGAVGELYAYAFLPLPLLGWFFILRKSYFKGIITASIGMFLVFTSHTVSALIILYLALICAGAAMVFGLLKQISLRIPLFIFLSVLWGISLAAFFLIPAFMEQKLTGVSFLTSGGSDFRSHFVYFSQLWDSSWGFAGSSTGYSDGMSFKIGKLHVIFALLSVTVLIFQYTAGKLTSFHRSAVIGLSALVMLSVFLMLAVSKPIWEILPFFTYIQYPWRFLSFTILGISVLIAMGMRFSPLRLHLQIVILTVAAIILFNLKLFVPSYIYYADDAMYTGFTNLIGNLSKISDEYLPRNFLRDQYPGNLGWRNVSKPFESAFFSQTDLRSNYRSYTVEVQSSASYTAPLSYFPGWHAKVDGVEVQINEHEGLTALKLQEGYRHVEFVLKQTPTEILSNFISLLTFILLVYVSLILKRKAHE